MNVIKGAAEAARGKAVSVTGAIGSAIDKDKYLEIGLHLKDLAKERAGVNLESLKAAGYGLTEKAGARYHEAKKTGQMKLFDLGAPLRAQVMFGLLCATKSAATADPDMCDCVRSRILDLIEVFWSDLTVFVEQLYEDTKESTVKGAATLEELGEQGVRPMLLGPRWWRARILHSFLPYDVSFFGQLKWPSFWALTIISLCPVYGIRIMFFALIYLLIMGGQPADEYQLVCYILGFKGSQFISSGMICGVVAAVKYYMCVHPGGTHTCDTDGPGANQDFLTGCVDFFGSCVLTWLAFLSLPCSDRSAGLRDATGGADEGEGAAPAPRGCCGSAGYDQSKGGRLKGLLGWELCSFCFSCLFGIALLIVDTHHLRPGGAASTPVDAASLQAHFADDAKGWMQTWEGRTAIFWTRMVYAFGSFPFVVFLIPGLNSILTHTVATGFNKNGACVPFMLHPMPEEPATRASKQE